MDFGFTLALLFKQDPEAALAYMRTMPQGEEYTQGLFMVLGTMYSRYSRELTRWLMSLMVEGWFVSAMLAYLASYWFTVDQCPPMIELAGLRTRPSGSSVTS